MGLYSDFSSYISKKVILSKNDIAEGIILTGIDSNFAKISLNRIIRNGKVDFKNDEYGIIIGQKLADRFNVKIGDKLTAFAIE